MPYDVSVEDQSVWTYEPHLAARVTKQMLDDATDEGDLMAKTGLAGRSVATIPTVS